jgi:hypothetical protein
VLRVRRYLENRLPIGTATSTPMPS